MEENGTQSTSTWAGFCKGQENPLIKGKLKGQVHRYFWVEYFGSGKVRKFKIFSWG